MTAQRDAARAFTASANNALATLTVPVPGGTTFYLTGIVGTYASSPTPTRLAVTGGLVMAFAAPLVWTPTHPIAVTSDLTVSLPAGGGVGDLTVTGYYEPEPVLDTAGASLVLDFLQAGGYESAARTASGRPVRPSFARNSVATFFDRDGVLKTAAADMPRIDYDPASVRTNLLARSAEFSSATWNRSNVALADDGALAPDGTMTADRLVPTNVGTLTRSINQSLTLAAGTRYTYSVYARGIGVTGNFGIALRVMDNAGTSDVRCNTYRFNSGVALPPLLLAGMFADPVARIAAVGGGWFRCDLSFTALVDIVNARTEIYYGGYLGTDGTEIRELYLWGAQLERGPVATPYIPTTSAPASVADICRGLLIEEARTNSVRNNTMVGAATGTPGTLPTSGWTVSGPSAAGLTRTVVGTGTVDGVSYIDLRFAGTPAAGVVNVVFDSPGVAATPGQAWALSTYLALVGGTLDNITGYTLRFDEGNPSYLRTALAATLPAPTNALTRHSGVATIGASTTQISGIYFQFGCNAAPIDVTFRIGMPQLELGAFPTSVIPTTTAAVTRAADVCSMPVSAIPGFSQTQGTLFAEGSPNSNTASVRSLADLNNGTVSNRISVTRDTNGRGLFYVQDANVGQASPSPTGAFGDTGRIAGAWAVNDFQTAVNGALGTLDTAGTVPTVSQLNVGSHSDSGNNVNGHIRRLAYWPQRLPNNELRRLTL